MPANFIGQLQMLYIFLPSFPPEMTAWTCFLSLHLPVPLVPSPGEAECCWLCKLKPISTCHLMEFTLWHSASTLYLEAEALSSQSTEVVSLEKSRNMFSCGEIGDLRETNFYLFPSYLNLCILVIGIFLSDKLIMIIFAMINWTSKRGAQSNFSGFIIQLQSCKQWFLIFNPKLQHTES